MALCDIIGGEWRRKGFRLERVFGRNAEEVRRATSVVSLSIFQYVFLLHIQAAPWKLHLPLQKLCGARSCYILVFIFFK